MQFFGEKSSNLVLKMLNLRCLLHIHVEMYSRPSRSMSLEFRGEICAGKINLRVVPI